MTEATPTVQPSSAEETAPSQYDAFVSYAHADRAVTTAIQKGLHQIGRRLGQLRALRVFRDDTNLTASPDLWGRITDALDSSRYLIVVLSPQSAASHWVNEEISYWLAHRDHEQLLLVLAEGRLRWDATNQRFDPAQSDAAPPALTAPGSLPVEPLYIDVSDDAPWDLRSLVFRDKLTALAAPIHGKPKDQLSGDDLREQRRFRRLRAAAVTALAILTVVSVIAALAAVQKQREADARLREAVVAKLNAEGASMLAGLTPGGDERAIQELLAANAIQGNGVPILDAQIARFTTQKIIDTGSRLERVAYSPDGHRIATAQADGTVRQWDSTTGAPIGSPLKGHTGQVVDVAYTTDGAAIASAGFDGFRLLNANTGAVLSAPGGSGKSHISVAVSPHGEIAVTGDDADTLEFWSTRTGALAASSTVFTDPRIPDHNHLGISDVAYDREGTLVAVSAMNGLIGFYDARSGDPRPPPLESRRTNGDSVPAYKIAFSPNGHTLAVAADDLQLWNVDDRTLAHRIALDPSITSQAGVVAFSPDGRRVATGRSDGAVQLWDPDTGTQVGATMFGHTAMVMGIAFSPDGRQLATTSIDGSLRLWNASIGQTMRGADKALGWVGFNRDGHRVGVSGDTAFQQWDLTSGQAQPPAMLTPQPEAIWFNFTASGRAVVATANGTVATLNPDAGQLVRPPVHLPVPDGDDFIRYAVTSDGRTLAWGSTEQATIHLANAVTGDAIGKPLTATAPASTNNAPDPALADLVFTPDGQHLVASYDDGLRVWNTATSQPEGTAMTDPGPPNNVMDIAVSRDGTTVAAGRLDGTVELWDLATRTQLPHSPLRGHTGPVARLAFGPGHQLASISGDATVRLWDTSTGAPTAAPITRRGDTITGVALSPDGRLVASTSLGGTLLLSPALADPGQLCDKLSANITHEQWRQWVSPAIDYITTCPKLPPAHD